MESAEASFSLQGYLSEMCKAAKGKGATCLIASVTPKNKFSGSSLNYNSPYTSQAKAAAASSGSIYVPHLETIGKQVAAQGMSVAQNYWLSGNQLQSNAAGADAFAAAFAGELADPKSLTCYTDYALLNLSCGGMCRSWKCDIRLDGCRKSSNRLMLVTP